MGVALTFAARPEVPNGLVRAIGDAERLLFSAESHALLLAELGDIELPPAARADATQLRAIASLYLASTLETAGLIDAADDLTRLMRSGAVDGDLGDAAGLVQAFWEARNQRPAESERLAMFARLFGTPAGPGDAAGQYNAEFEELLLDLCDAIMKAVDGGSQNRVREAAIRLAENVAGAASGMMLMLAREILDTLAHAIAILNNQQILTLLHVRTLWDAIGAIDGKFKRDARPTLTMLRRGRSGMAVLAWLAEHVDTIETGGGALIHSNDPVVDSAVDWVDETLSIVRGGQGEPASAGQPGASAPAPAGSGTSWRDLGS